MNNVTLVASEILTRVVLNEYRLLQFHYGMPVEASSCGNCKNGADGCSSGCPIINSDVAYSYLGHQHT